MRGATNYKVFGELLYRVRLSAGIAQQSGLANLLNTTQQTISRWESGLSRPRLKDLPLLAKVLNADLDELLTVAGYNAKPLVATMQVATYDKPFPLDALSPESFERFCMYFLRDIYPEATVNRAGVQGHKQDGLDIEVVFPDGAYHTFQCKRVQEFGAKKIDVAVEKHTRPANRKHLLLSCFASPQARTAMRKHNGWDIWDREDISSKIRQNLSMEKQIRLVDTFFRGQRFSLLGVDEASPWQTLRQLSESFESESGLFNHEWKLVGRDAEVKTLLDALCNPKMKTIQLMGSGGSGKSRVLLQVIREYERKNKKVLIRFLMPTDMTPASLEYLGDSEKLLIVDDAQDHDNLQLLFQYALNEKNKTRLVLSYRPYGKVHIEAQAGNYSLHDKHSAIVGLNPLTLEQATALAQQVLKKYKGPEHVAKEIARFTLDCPLFTVIGAQVVATEKKQYELAKNEDHFRKTLMARFRKIITGEISKSDAPLIAELLKIIALLQPFYPGDTSISVIAEQVGGIRPVDTNRLIRLLHEGGVLFKRGSKYRLSPDLLADYIIEDACIGIGDSSTGYAEKVFEIAGDAHIKNILLNLGKLDWRRSDGNPSNSRLLDGIWSSVKPSHQYSDPYIQAVTDVAYYQPKRALSFVDKMMQRGHYLTELPNILKYVAYNFDELRDACELLWELGKNDNRATNQHPGHAIRVLSEMCSVERNKPQEYHEAVVDFVLSLIDDDDSWNHYYTPFDILENILSAEGNFTESHGISFSFGSFSINYDFVAKSREKVIKATFSLLLSANTKAAVLAAEFLAEGLRYYSRGGDAKHRTKWDKEFVATLRRIEQIMLTETLDPLVQVAIARSISWHAHFAQNKTTTPIAKRIIKLLPDSIEFRTILTIVDGYGHILERYSYQKSDSEWNKFIMNIVSDLQKCYSDPETLRSFMGRQLEHINKNRGKSGSTASPHVLFGTMIQASPGVARAIVEDALINTSGNTVDFAGMALSKLLHEDHNAALEMASNLVNTGNNKLMEAIGWGYGGVNPAQFIYGAEDVSILQQVLVSTDQRVVCQAIGAMRTLARTNARLAIDLLKIVNIGMSCHVADNLLMLFYGKHVLPFEMLTNEDVGHFLSSMLPLQELDGHWIEEFLAMASADHPWLTAQFFMDRVDLATEEKGWKYRPCNHGPYSHVPLKFRSAPDFGQLLRHVTRWMQSKAGGDYMIESHLGNLFDAMFAPFDSEILGCLQDWVDQATANDFHIITKIIREAPNGLVFENKQFVLRVIEKGKLLGSKCFDAAENAFYASASSGLRSGVPGQPFSKDIAIKSAAEKALGEMPRFSPAYGLYDALRKGAEQGIERSIRERDEFED